MRIGSVADNPIEWVLQKLGVIPTPMVETFLAPLLARSVMVGTRLGVFEVLQDGPLTAPQVAEKLGTHPVGTEKLLNALVGGKYVRYDGQRYRLGHVARKWLLKSSKSSLHDNLIHRFLEWYAI